MQLEYLDLYLIHTPFAFEEVGEELHPVDENGEFRLDLTTNHVAVWAEMEKQVSEGRTKAIGLSNFNAKQISKILSNAKLPISNLQIELHLYFQQKEMVNPAPINMLLKFQADYYYVNLMQNTKQSVALHQH